MMNNIGKKIKSYTVEVKTNAQTGQYLNLKILDNWYQTGFQF